jgi:hypothetical protein
VLTNATSQRVYGAALIGYALFVWAVYNGAYLFSLGRPWVVVRSLAPALAVGLAVSFSLSRTIAPWTAAFGLTAGAFVFAALTTRAALAVLRDVDYHYFAAY